MQTPLQTPMQTPLPGTAQTPLPGTAQTPLPGTADSSMYNISTGGTPISPGDYPSLVDSGLPEPKPGRPSPYMVHAVAFVSKLVTVQHFGSLPFSTLWRSMHYVFKAEMSFTCE